VVASATYLIMNALVPTKLFMIMLCWMKGWQDRENWCFNTWRHISARSTAIFQLQLEEALEIRVIQKTWETKTSETFKI
jgi:hypothetical protein